MGSSEKEATIRMIASNQNWVKGNTVQQLKQTRTDIPGKAVLLR